MTAEQLIPELLTRADLLTSQAFVAARQAVFVQSIVNIVFFAAILAIDALFILFVIKAREALLEYEELAIVGIGTLALLLCLATGAVLATVPSALSALFAPDWYAMRELLKAIPGSQL